jgi:hypothetical protein
MISHDTPVSDGTNAAAAPMFLLSNLIDPLSISRWPKLPVNQVSRVPHSELSVKHLFTEEKISTLPIRNCNPVFGISARRAWRFTDLHPKRLALAILENIAWIRP